MNYEAISTWSQVTSAVLFAVVLVWMFRKFLTPAIVAAQQARNNEIAVAEERRDRAHSALASMQHVIADAQKDADLIRERAKADALREREEALAQAREAGARSISNARGELQRSRVTAREVLRGDLVEKALEIARSQASNTVDSSLNARLVSRLVDTLERGAQRDGN
ncbi:MAG: ATP synthase F0 subunit B [Candidatus Eremiobacteraeota bacterium]|nr:ATP synthase F0 subunit B [Candidatus Eremiobacteraeota bacterium]